MRRFALIAALSFLSPIVFSAETLKTTFNPFSGRLQYITEVSTQNFTPGSGITINCADGVCTFESTVAGGSSGLETLFGTARSSPTNTLRGNTGDFAGSVTGSTMTVSLSTNVARL